MVVRTPATTILSRAVRSMSSFHRTAEAIRSREQTVDEVLRTTVFSPENFPRVLTVSIWVATLEFYGILGWKYYSRQVDSKSNGSVGGGSLATTGNFNGATNHKTNSKWLTVVHH